MTNLLPRDVSFFAGGDALAKYGTLVRRMWPADRGGEQLKETFTRTGTAWALQQNGLLLPSAANVPRVEWVIDSVTGLLQPYWLLEAAATNAVLRNRDLNNAAWTKTTMTAALDQVGIDGGANTASSLLATAGNATCLQAITLGSAARFQSAWVKRLVGSGTVQMTLDNGATWTAIALTTAWARVTVPTQTLANPTVGFRLVTNADKIAVDGVQNEAGTFPTSTIFTAAAAVTRNIESCSVPWYVGPGASWFYLRFLERGGATIGSGECLQVGSFPGRLLVQGASGNYRFYRDTLASVVTTTSNGPSPVFGTVVELLGLLNTDGSVALRSSVNGGADVVATPGGALALDATWGAPLLLRIGSGEDGVNPIALSRLVIGTGPVSTIADARTVLP